MSEPTPGPWNQEVSHRRPTVWAKGMLVCEVAGQAEFDYANATLIAAAPDLLAACEPALTFLRHIAALLPGNAGGVEASLHVTAIRNAIAKAKGAR